MIFCKGQRIISLWTVALEGQLERFSEEDWMLANMVDKEHFEILD